MKKLYILLFLCSVFFLQLKAQKKCGSDEYYNYLMETDSGFAKNQQILEKATEEFTKNYNLKSASNEPIYAIPVVVHVLWNEIADSLSYNQILSQINVLNNDYQKLNSDRDKCPDYFKPLQADCQIKFILARRKPNGDCTTGIEYKRTNKDHFNFPGTLHLLPEDAKFSLLGGIDAWDRDKYLNIWIVPDLIGFDGKSKKGYSSAPGCAPEIDGVVICQNDFGSVAYNDNHDFTCWSYGRTATHEIGHWFNLKHIWGPLCSFSNDLVDDTPAQTKSHDGECPEGIQKSCLFSLYGDMYMNYMDYTNDECMNMFTIGQKKRMHASIELYRKTLVSISNLALISPKADLTIVNQQVSSTSVTAGNSITVYFAEDNKGSLSAPANYVNIHLSSDDKLTPGENGDIYLDQYFVEQGVPGRTSTKEYSKEITIPSTVSPGDYYLYFAADGTGVVTECDNTNNFASVKIIVTANNSPNPPSNLTAVAEDEQVILSWLAPSSGSPTGYSIYRGSSEDGIYSLISSNIKTTSKTITGLTNGATYWFYVQAVYTTGERVASTKISAKPATSIKPPNDDCSGAILLTSSVSCNYLESQTVNNATASGKSKGSCDGYTGTPALADVWYYFKAQSTLHTITVNPNGSQLDAVIVAYNSCSSNTGINCSDITGGPGTISTLNLSGLVPGDYYYIRVYDYGMQTTSGNFRICLTGEPANNSCIIASITPNSETHGPASFSTTPGADDIYFNAQPNCSFEITNYCSWLTVSPMSGTTNNNGQAFINYSIEANTSTSSRVGIFYINGSPVTITQNGEDGTDDDNDGVINSIDLCPNTPVGAVINENGCSDVQIITEYDNLQYYDVLLNTPKAKTIGLFNNGVTDYTATSITLAGENADQFSIVPAPPIVVSPDSYQNLEVTFNPTNIGAKMATIEIVTDAIEIPSKTITLNGKGVDQLNKILICMPSKTYNYGNIKIASSESKTFVIQNLGSDICTISGTSLEGLNKDDFSITSHSELPSVLEVGEYFVVTVKFSPSSSGSKSAILQISNNSDNISSVLPVELYGNGIIDVYSGNNNVVAAYEYWFDSDYESKIVTPTFYEDVSELWFQCPTPNLENGLHSFHIRYLDKKGYWSAIASEFFHKLPVTAAGTREITAYEYWFDDDFANKISTEITSGQTITTNEGFDVSELQTGLHSYHVRYKDDAGQWSSVVSEFFHKLPVTAAGTREITACEYWFDDDFANKISTEIAPGQTITTNEGFDVSELQTGLHSYHVRYKDDAGQWSSVVSEFFHKFNSRDIQLNLISGYRYWFDNDFENVNAIELPVPVNPFQQIWDINTGNLTEEEHTIHFQFKDTQQAWSSVVSNTFNTDSLQYQEISLSTGWNIMSMNVVPADKDLENIFQPLINEGSLKKVMDESGNAIENQGILDGWQNGIGSMLSTEGYKVNVSTACVLRVEGTTVNYKFAIPLNKGWNIVGYPHNNSYNGQAVIQQLLDRGTLVKVQDEKGNSIEDWGIFGSWQNNIGDFIPGEGYKIKVNDKDTLWIYESYPTSSALLPGPVATSHFVPEFEGNGVDHMNINLVGLPDNFLQVGDELAIFDGATCVGAVTIMSHHINNQKVSIVASATDNFGMAGFAEGNQFVLKLWSAQKNQELALEPEIVTGLPTFSKHETTIASLEKYATTGLSGLLTPGLNEVNCYPNPFNQEITIEINLAADSEVEVEILNQLGQRIKLLTTKRILLHGLNKITWNGKNAINQTVVSGIYHIKVNVDGTILHRKIVFTASK